MNEIARRPLPYMTVGDFLMWPGDGTGRRFHLIDGEMRAMSPASDVHSRVQGNLAVRLENAAVAAGSSLGVAIEPAIIPQLTGHDNVRIPDVAMMDSEANQGEIGRQRPVVIVEVLSPGNAPTTRENVRAYATIASVQEIVVMSTTRIEAEIHRRDETGAWPREPEVVKPGERLRVRSVGLDCPVEDAYRRTWLFPSASSNSR